MTINRPSSRTRRQTRHLVGQAVLVVVHVAAVLLGALLSTAEAKKAAEAKTKLTQLEEQIRAAGGRLDRNDYRPGNPVDEVVLVGPSVGDAEM